MKFIQINVWQGRVLWHVKRYLEREQPDILCMQEVYSSEQPVPTWDSFSSLEQIREVVPHEYCFFAPLYAFKVAGRPVTFGNTIISRFPIEDEHFEFVNGHFVADMATEELLPNTRNYQSCRLILPNGQKISLINHHGFWDGTPYGNEMSVEKMKIIRNAAEQLPSPRIVTGDMNVIPESKPMQLFEGFMENLLTTYSIETTLSPLAHAFDRDNIVACDNVLVSPDIKVQDFNASDYLMSDHKALVLEFEVD